MAKKNKAIKKAMKARGKKKSGIGWRFRFLMLGVLAASAIFLETTLVVVIGLLPALVAALVDRYRDRTLTVCVGVMNLAGCSPFLIELWANPERNMDLAFSIVANPTNIIIIYTAAGMGWLIYINVTSFVASIMLKRGEKRLQKIKAEKAEFIKRWGIEVTGTVPLNEDGYPIEQPESAANA